MPTNRFLFLLIALVILLVGYPYMPDNQFGAFLGGMTSLLLLVAAIFAVRTHKHALLGACVLALTVIVLSVWAFISGVRGNPLVEASFFLFYALITTVIFVEVIRERDVTRNILIGIVCVYLLIGTAFATLYDFVETIFPGSFQFNTINAADTPMRWRNLLYYSFTTLTTTGYGDVTPSSTQAQSLSIIEGIIGVLFVAVFVARLIGMYNHRKRI
ncbi:potassium channel family protein [Acidobacteriota bacterium]